jgi:hypothetical protein
VTRPTRRALLVAAVVALAAAIALEWLWTSDEERVTAALDALQSAIERRDADAADAWVAPDVTFPSGVPGAAAGGGLHDGLAALFLKISSVKLRRDETTITFGDEGAATVVAKGSGHVETADHGGLFTFEVEANFRKQPDARFLLERVARLRVEPGIR